MADETGQAPPQKTTEAFVRLVALVNRLRGPDGCPWDQEQTHQSLRPYVLEEAYEVVEAIDALAQGDPAGGNKLREELGDLLLQVLLHAEIAGESDLFDLGSVLETLHDKLVRRHPHVFGTAEAPNTAAVGRVWEAVKAQERHQGRSAGASHGDKGESRLDGVPASLPAMLRSYQLQKEAGKVGFDWECPELALKKVWEEAREVRAAWREEDAAQLEAEIGDLFFALINVSRLLSINPELALAGAARRFEARFRRMEAVAQAAGQPLETLTLAQQEHLYQQAKEYLKKL